MFILCILSTEQAEIENTVHFSDLIIRRSSGKQLLFVCTACLIVVARLVTSSAVVCTNVCVIIFQGMCLLLPSVGL